MLSKETIILSLLIKIFFVFIFHYGTFHSIFYKIFFTFFVFDGLTGLTLFTTYFQKITAVPSMLIMYNIFFFTVLAMLYHLHNVIQYYYQINHNQSKKNIFFALIIMTSIKYIIYQIIIHHQYHQNNLWWLLFFLYYLYYDFFALPISSVIKSKKYYDMNKISFLYNLLFYFQIINSYLITPFFFAYEMIFTTNMNITLTTEKVLFIKKSFIMLNIISLIPYIIIYLTYLLHIIKKTNFHNSRLANDYLSLSIENIAALYSYKNSFEETIKTFLIYNIHIITKISPVNIIHYDPLVNSDIKYNFLIAALEENPNSSTCYFYTKDFFIENTLGHLYQNNKKYYDTELILDNLEKHNILFFYCYQLEENKKNYIIILKDKENIHDITATKIYRINKMIDNLALIYNEFINYFYYGNVFYNSYTTKLSMEENKENFFHYYNYIKDGMQTIYYAAASYHTKENEDDKKLYHNITCQNIIQTIEHELHNIEKINNYNESNKHSNIRQYMIIQSAINKKKELCYSATVLPITLPDHDYTRYFNLYTILQSIFGDSPVLAKNDIDFFFDFMLGFKCKIILSKHIESKIFFILLQYFLERLQYTVYHFNFAADDVDIFFNNFTTMQTINTKIAIFSYGIHSNNIEKQEYFYKKYIVLIAHTHAKIKWYIFSPQDKLHLLTPLIIAIATSVTYTNYIHALNKDKIKWLIESFNRIQKEDTYHKIFQSFINNFNTNDLTYNIYDIFDHYNFLHTQYKEELLLLKTDYYLKQALSLGKDCLKDDTLMKKLLIVYDGNYSKIAAAIGVHKSTISRYFQKK